MLRTIGEVNPLPSALTRLARSVLTLGLLVLVKESDANTTQKWPDRDLYTPKSQYIYYRVHKWVELYWTSVGKLASEKRIDSFLKHHLLHNHLAKNNLVDAKWSLSGIFSIACKGGHDFRSDVYGIPYKFEIFIRFA